jgi:hypothetical protein
MDRANLRTLTDRWRARHDAARKVERLEADAAREERAARAFPFRTSSPEAYVAAHGDAMIGFTFDDVRYSDPDLDAWLLEVGRLLRARR